MTQAHDAAIENSPIRRRPRKLSELFAQLSRDAGERVSLGAITEALGARAFAPLLVLFSAVNLAPLPPGSSAILGLPMLVIAAQMAKGDKRAWLPAFLNNRSISADQFRSMINWVIPHLRRLEGWIKPRYWPFWRRRGDRVVGIIAVVLATSVVLPIPGGNWLPAFAATLLGLSLLERDGVLFGIGAVVGVCSIAWVCTIVGSAVMASKWAVSYLF